MSTVDSWTGSLFHTAVPPDGYAHDAHAPAIPAIDPDLVQQTRAEIRRLAREIAELCQSDVPLEEFYEAFLVRVVSALAAVGGAVWTQDADGRLRLRYQVNVAQAGLTAEDDTTERHARLLERIAAERQPALVPPEASGDESDGAGNPTPWLLLLGVLAIDDHTRAIVEIFQRPSGGPVTQRGYLRFLSQMCDLANDFLKGRRLRQLKQEQQRWQEAEQFIQAVHRDLDLRATAYAIANEGRRLIGADRVSIAVRRGRRCEITAISGLDTFDRRATQVDRLARLATVVVNIREPLWYPFDSVNLSGCAGTWVAGAESSKPQRSGTRVADPAESSKSQRGGARVADPAWASKTQPQPPGPPTVIDSNGRELPPQIEQALQEYLDASPARSIGVLPLSRPCATGDSPAVQNSAALGALIVEQFQDSRLSEGLLSRTNIATRHASAALHNARQHRRVIALPQGRIWRGVQTALGRTGLSKTCAVLAVVVAVVAALVLIPAELTIPARGKLLPVTRQHVYASLDGTVEEVAVRHGQMVRKGDVLVRLRNSDLEMEIASLVGQQQTTAEQIESLQRTMLTSGHLPFAERSRLSNELSQFKQRADGIQKQLEICRRKEHELMVCSPVSGQIATWGVDDGLRGRPVLKGELLMTVIDAASAWELELELRERDVSHVARSLRDRMGVSERRPHAVPPVTFGLRTLPGREFTGRLVEMERMAVARESDSDVVLVRAAVEHPASTEFLGGAAAKARIACGKRSLGYVWLRDLIETVQSEVLFWL